MKYKLLIAIYMCLSIKGWSQTVDGKNISTDSMVQYLEIHNSGFLKRKPIVIINYGQKIETSYTDTKVEAPDGDPIIFNSAMDAVNHFQYWGWELMSVHDVAAGVAYYVMRRRGKG